MVEDLLGYWFVCMYVCMYVCTSICRNQTYFADGGLPCVSFNYETSRDSALLSIRYESNSAVESNLRILNIRTSCIHCFYQNNGPMLNLGSNRFHVPKALANDYSTGVSWTYNKHVMLGDWSRRLTPFI